MNKFISRTYSSSSLRSMMIEQSHVTARPEQSHLAHLFILLRYLLNFMGVFSSIATHVRISCATFAFRWRTFSSPNFRDRLSSNLTARHEQVHLAHCFSLSNRLISYSTQFQGCFSIKYRTCSSFVRHFRVFSAHVFSFLLALT